MEQQGRKTLSLKGRSNGISNKQGERKSFYKNPNPKQNQGKRPEQGIKKHTFRGNYGKPKNGRRQFENAKGNALVIFLKDNLDCMMSAHISASHLKQLGAIVNAEAFTLAERENFLSALNQKLEKRKLTLSHFDTLYVLGYPVLPTDVEALLKEKETLNIRILDNAENVAKVHWDNESEISTLPLLSQALTIKSNLLYQNSDNPNIVDNQVETCFVKNAISTYAFIHFTQNSLKSFKQLRLLDEESLGKITTSKAFPAFLPLINELALSDKPSSKATHFLLGMKTVLGLKDLSKLFPMFSREKTVEVKKDDNAEAETVSIDIFSTNTQRYCILGEKIQKAQQHECYKALDKAVKLRLKDKNGYTVCGIALNNIMANEEFTSLCFSKLTDTQFVLTYNLNHSGVNFDIKTRNSDINMSVLVEELSNSTSTLVKNTGTHSDVIEFLTKLNPFKKVYQVQEDKPMPFVAVNGIDLPEYVPAQ